jgi:HAD superfamily hydrolase (TIGR01549 family)
MAIKALILDLHGVLVTKFPLEEYIKAVKKFLKEKGYEEGTYERWKQGFRTITAAMEQHSLKDDYLKVMDSLPVYSDKDDELVDLLFDCPFELFLATDSSRDNAIKTLKEANISPNVFKMIITGNDVKRGKPYTEMYKKIIDAHPYIKPEEWLVVGDRETDIYPAAELGLNALLCGKDIFKGWLECKH